MSLKDIKTLVKAYSGITSPDVNQDLLLIADINRAAQQIWFSRDLPVSLKEVTVKATSDLRISLPSFVKSIRAIRSCLWDDLWTLHDLRPRYNSLDWPNKWNKGRVIGEFPTANDLSGAPGTINIASVTETGLTVTIIGSTSTSNRVTDTISIPISAVIQSISWTKTFTEIQFIRKNQVTENDVILKSSDDTEISIIYADQKEARYIVIDVSCYPTIQTCPDGTFSFEVLYKPACPLLIEDEDSFPLVDYDEDIAMKTIQLQLEGQEGKETLALLKDKRIDRNIKEKTFDKTGTIQHKMCFKKNRVMDMFDWRLRF